MNLNSLLFSQSACKHLQHKSASYIYLYLPPNPRHDLPSLNFSSIAWYHPRTHPPLWTVNFAVSFLFFSRFATINCNPTYSQSGCFLLRICVRVICSTASTILLLARRPADISTIVHSCCFRYLMSSCALTWWLAFRSRSTPFCMPPVF